MTEAITPEVARSFLKADDEDGDLISLQLASATRICEDYCNRKFYADDADFEADFTEALADRSALLSARASALSFVVDAGTDGDDTRRMILDRYASRLADIKRRIHGIVLDDAINAAIFLTLGHLYENREDNLASGQNVIQLPVGAQRILQPKLWIGDLVSDGRVDTDCIITGS